MKVLHLTAGTGLYHCGSCIRDNALVAGLQAIHQDASLVPLYLNLVVDGDDCSANQPLFLGGINTYLQQHVPLFRYTPHWLHRSLDSGPALRLAASAVSMTNPSTLGEMTLSLMRGLNGHQAHEIQRLCDWIRTVEQPDVVVMSNGLLAGLGASIREECKVKVIGTLQSELHFIEGLEESYRDSVWTLMADALRQLDGIVAVSEYCQQEVSRRSGLDIEDITVIRSGLDLESFSPRETSDQSPMVVGYLARLAEEKGALVALEAFELLRERPGLETLQLHMGGSVAPGNQPIVKTLKTAASRQEGIRIHTNMTQSEKAAFLSTVSVLCVPGRHHEVAALYALEAMASGVPIVAAQNGGAEEWVKATGGGVTYPAGDMRAMLDAVESLLKDPARRAEMGSTAQSIVKQEFSSKAMAQRWVDYLTA